MTGEITDRIRNKCEDMTLEEIPSISTKTSAKPMLVRLLGTISIFIIATP